MPLQHLSKIASAQKYSQTLEVHRFIFNMTVKNTFLWKVTDTIENTIYIQQL